MDTTPESAPTIAWNPPLHALTGEGVFPVENHKGQFVRWTSQWPTLNIEVAPGNYELVIDTGGLRGRVVDSYLKRVRWNDHTLSPAGVVLDERCIRFRVQAEWCRPGRVQQLKLFSLALKPDNHEDQRRLGVPIVSLSLRSGVCAAPPDADDASILDVPAPPSGIRSRAPYKVISVNTSDFGGGAERSAWTLFRGFQQEGIDSWLVVGQKRTNDPHVIPFHSSPYIDHRFLNRANNLGERLHRWVSAQRGHEDFDFPLSWLIPEITGTAPDVVLLHNLHGGYFDLRALGALSRQYPVVLSVRDSWLLTGHCATTDECNRWEHGCGQCPDLKRYPAIARDATPYNWQRKAAALADSRLYVAAPSQWTLDRVRRSLIGTAIIESRVIPNGIDLERFRSVDKGQARSKVPVPDSTPLIVFGACLSDGGLKDAETTHLALQRLANLQGAAPTHVIVVGEARERRQIGPLTVEYLARQSQETFARYLQAADLYVHVSREEAFSRTVAEALACGTVVVASDVGGTQEVVGGQARCMLVPPRDPLTLAQRIHELCCQPEQLSALGKAAAVHAQQRFDERHMVQRYLAWLEEICNQRAVERG